MPAHEERLSEFTEADRDDLMRGVAEHLKEAHNIDKTTETLMSYLEVTSVTAWWLKVSQVKVPRSASVWYPAKASATWR